jgi:hypothetical protein
VIHPRTVILAFVAALALGSLATPTATAQPAPSPADIEAAKKAFNEGKALFEAKKYGEAVEKFKESYRLSKNPLLLYNIAVSLGANNQEDMALFYYKKFLTDAPADAAQRPDAETAAKALEAKLGPGAGQSGTAPTGTGGGTKPDPTKTEPKPEPPKGPTKIKPPGTYTAADFKHRAVEEAPPNKPLDLTCVVPVDSGFGVTMFFRSAGEAQFTPVPMKWRYNELVGRVPAKKMIGTSVQYYLEVKDQAGGVVTKVAKAASPNVVYLEATASAQFYPDFNPDTASTVHEEGGGAATTAVNTGGGGGAGGGTPRVEDDPLHADTSDDPLAQGPPKGNGGKRVGDATTFTPDGGGGGGGGGGGPHGDGFMDVGSSKFKYTKWGTTIVGVGLLATSVVFYFRATNAADTIETEASASTCPDGMPRPCEFDDFLRDAEATGKSAETMSMVTLGVGAAITGVAAYFWIKDLRGGGREHASRARKKKMIAAPSIGGGVIGGTAAWEW